jgi:hypothetical protein
MRGLAQFNIFGFIAKSCTIDDLSQGRVAGRLSGETLDLKRHDFYTEIKDDCCMHSVI